MKHPLTPIVLAMMRSENGCRICSEAITHHEMLGDQVLAANRGGSMQMHRRCWEVLGKDEQNRLATTWTIADAANRSKVLAGADEKP